MAKEENKGTDYTKVEPTGQKVYPEEEKVTEPFDKKERYDKVVSEVAKAPKKSIGKRFLIALIGPEGGKGVVPYLIQDVIIPASKNLVVDFVETGINMLVFKESRRKGSGYNNYQQSNYRPPNTFSSGAQYRNYNSAYSNPNNTIAPQQRKAGGISHVDEYIIPNRNEAITVLELLRTHIERYGQVSVAEYFDLIGIEPQYTDHNYGWQKWALNDTRIRPVSGGYIIELPEVEVL